MKYLSVPQRHERSFSIHCGDPLVSGSLIRREKLASPSAHSIDSRTLGHNLWDDVPCSFLEPLLCLFWGSGEEMVCKHVGVLLGCVFSAI